MVGSEVRKAASIDPGGPRKLAEGFGAGPKDNWKPWRGLNSRRR